jgi:hypothetical protein
MVALKSAIAFSVAILAVLIPLEYFPSMAALSPFAQSCRCVKLRAGAPMLSYIRVVRARVGVGLLWFSALAPSSSSWARRDAITLLGWFPPFFFGPLHNSFHRILTADAQDVATHADKFHLEL